jgi:hypothetical protein
VLIGLLLEKGSKDEKKNDTKKEMMKACEGSKPQSLLFELNGFTHELKQIIFGPQQNNILSITWGQTMGQETFHPMHHIDERQTTHN